jgi:hypothetical protein
MECNCIKPCEECTCCFSGDVIEVDIDSYSSKERAGLLTAQLEDAMVDPTHE